MEPPLTKSERESLKAIYRLSRDGQDAHTGALAEALKVSPGTVTATVKRLAERGLLDHKLYKGVELTPAGHRAAVATIRRHRIVERFLADMLGYAWNEADRLAGSFEHELPQEVEERLYVALDRPAECPHGFPIPAPEVAEIPALPRLYDLEAGDQAIVAVPGSVDGAVVAFLETLGVRPGVGIEVLEKHPFDGPIVVRAGGKERTLGDKVARQIYVRKLGPAWPERNEPGPAWPERNEPGPAWPERNEPGPAWPERNEPGPAWPERNEPGPAWPERNEEEQPA